MLEDAIENNIRIKEVSTVVRYDGLDTSTEKPGKHGLGVFGFILRTVRDRRPLLFFGVSGFILLLFGLIFGIWCLNSYFTQSHIPFGPAIAASILILIGAFGVFAGLILNSISGMINGLTKLNRSQEKKLLEDNDEEKTPWQIPLNLPRNDILLSNINGQNNPHLTSMSHNLEDILPGYTIGQKIPKLVVLNQSHEEGFPIDVNSQDIPEPTVLNRNQNPSFINEPNGKEILKPSQLIDNNEEMAIELSDEYKIQRPQHLNNHHRELVHEDIEDKNIQI
jgi:hypothetical protein